MSGEITEPPFKYVYIYIFVHTCTCLHGDGDGCAIILQNNPEWCKSLHGIETNGVFLHPGLFKPLWKKYLRFPQLNLSCIGLAIDRPPSPINLNQRWPSRCV
uniref:Uncharacterized protein n=1 Tax=Micrurus carvalhoi TaxID=3147026 RepID=A0A2H6N7R9_9SAUR